MSWDNSYVYAWRVNRDLNIREFIDSCISHADTDQLNIIYNLIINNIDSNKALIELQAGQFKIEIHPAQGKKITTIYIDSEEDSYKINIINFNVLCEDMDDIYSAL